MIKKLIFIGLLLTIPFQAIAGLCKITPEKIYFNNVNNGNLVYVEYDRGFMCTHNNEYFPNYLYHKYPDYLIKNIGFKPISYEDININGAIEFKKEDVQILDKIIFSINRFLYKVSGFFGEFFSSFDSFIALLLLAFYYILPFCLFVYFGTEGIKYIFKIKDPWNDVNKRVFLCIFIILIVSMFLFDFVIY